MSYAVSASLQEAVYQALISDSALNALVGPHVYDAVPTGGVPSLYVTLGQEKSRDRSDKTGHGAEHDMTLSVVTDVEAFLAAKEVAGAISDALHGQSLVLGRGHLVGLWFLRATAKREKTGAVRRIDLTFRARVEDAEN